MNNIKVYLDEKLKEVKVSKELSNRILEDTSEKVSFIKKVTSTGKIAVIVATICLFFTVSVTVMAATSSAFNDFIYTMNPSLAKLLYPINQTSEDQGIRVEVLYAANDNYNAKVFFTIQDVLGKNRINDRLDLCDSCDINGPTAFGVEFISYDKETQTALFMLNGMGGESLSGKAVTFKINTLMSNKKKYDWYDTKIDLSAYHLEHAKAVPFSADNYYTGGDEKSEQILEPDQMDISLGENMEFVKISNIGFVDGRLHIQTKWETSFDNHGELLLIDKHKTAYEETNTVDCRINYFRTKEDEEKCGENRFTKHIEYIYDIADIEELSQYKLWGRFVEDGTFTKGDWRVNFRLEKADSITVMNPAGMAQSLEISSLGIYIKQYEGTKEECNVQLNLKDGTALKFFNPEFTEKVGTESLKLNLKITGMNTPFEVETIETIYLNDIIVFESTDNS